MNLFGRLRRALTEERIRLVGVPLRVDEIHVGDWLQLGSETWRVAGSESGAGGFGFRLAPLYGTTGACLLAGKGDLGRWKLRRGSWEVEIDPADLLLFPVGTTSA